VIVQKYRGSSLRPATSSFRERTPVLEQPADHRDGTRHALGDRFHAPCHAAREAMDPLKEGYRHDPHLRRSNGPAQVLRVRDSYVIFGGREE
jgi:hypothetical protein